MKLDILNQKSPRALMRAFLRDERGTVTVFSLMVFVLMIAVGGIAIDVMRYETQRAQLQYTLDRAVLAAAALNQTVPAQDVVESYFETSGLTGYRLDVDVDQGLNYRRVSATVESDIQSFFINMLGVRAMTSPASGAAEERIMNVEISMVLDISGSMGWNNKIVNMRNAANEFVDTVLAANVHEQLVSISIIPYNGRVNAGSTIESVFTLSNEHNFSACARFDDADFNDTTIDPDVAVERLAHFDYIYRGRYRNHSRSHCQTSDYASILPWSQNATALHNHINSLSADGWTAIDLGMRWGVGLLDPEAQSALSELIDGNQVHEDFEGRPEEFEDDETLKVVIVMTDGENTAQFDIIQPYKSGMSPVYRNPSNDRYSTYLPDYNLYYWHHTRTYNSAPYGGNNAEQLTWVEIWAEHTARQAAGEFFYYPWRDSHQINGGYRDGDLYDMYREIRYYSIEQYEGYGGADDNLQNICEAAQDEGIVIFAIAFEAPSGGRQAMQDCVGDDERSRYYEASGLEISEVFASIAQTINQLKLIQ